MTESFTSKDYVAIIRACHSSHVKKISMNGLVVEFHGHPEEVPEMIDQASPAVPVENHLQAEGDLMIREVEDMALLATDAFEYERVMEERAMQEHAEEYNRAERTVS